MTFYPVGKRLLDLCLVAACLALGGDPRFVSAQTTSDQAQFGDWTLQCGADVTGNGSICWLFQRFLDQDDNTQLADIRIGITHNDGVGTPILLMHVPSGILLTARAAFRVDEDDTNIAMNWHNCTEQRCTAARSLNSDEFDRLLEGDKIVIGYRMWQTTQPTVFEVPLAGVALGYQALEARMEAK